MTVLPFDRALGFGFARLVVCTLGCYVLPKKDWDSWMLSDNQTTSFMVAVSSMAVAARLMPAVVMPVGAEAGVLVHM